MNIIRYVYFGSPFRTICTTILVWLALWSCIPARAQSTEPRRKVTLDSSYVVDLSRRPTVRFYLSNKFNSLLVRSIGPEEDLRYRPNSHYNIGVGASYRRLTLNIGVPTPFANTDVDSKGRTRYFDAQANVYGDRQATNLFLQVYKGYHITSHTKAQLGWVQETDFPYRSELVQYNIGISTLRILQPERFSYRATFNQDAIQYRTQGSWLVGGYFTSYSVRGDSAIVPTRLANGTGDALGTTKALSMDLGPMVGRAVTIVHKRSWFFTASGAAGVGPGARRFSGGLDDGGQWRANVAWHFQARAGAGYNSRSWFFGAIYSQEFIGHVGERAQGYRWDVGNLKMIAAKHLLKRPPRAVDKGVRWINDQTH